MKKYLALVLAMIGFTSVYADESYLLWMIDDSDNWDWEEGSAKVYAIQSGSSTKNYLNIYAMDHSGTGTQKISAGNGDGAFAADFGAYTGNNWSYFVEVYNSDGGWNGMSKNALSYSEAANYIEVTDQSGSILVPATILNFADQGYTAAPEPNSAMLLLMGLSALALRRKRAAKKA